MTDIYNFSAGPSVLPKEVLQQAAEEMMSWHGSGMSVMEMSHRGAEFMSIMDEALHDFRELLNVPSHYQVLFLQGGGLGENAIAPMNLLGKAGPDPVIDFVRTGIWSGKSIAEAKKYARVNVAATAETSDFSGVPDVSGWALSEHAAYLHLCTNETIDGIEFLDFSQLPISSEKTPLVADMSSHILSRQIDVNQFGVIFAGAQKNVGPAGLTIVIVREDLLDRALTICPSAFEWKNIAANGSMFNTPPTWSIYVAGLVFKWLKQQGGVAAIEKINQEKAHLLYECIDQSRLYVNKVVPRYRSRMNVPFFLRDENLNASFLAEAKQNGLLQLKGHKSVGGMRASLYNAMPISGVKALIQFMKDFESRN